MRLRAVAPWTTVDDVLAEMEFEPLIAPSVETIELPSEEELASMRADVDPTGRTIRGRWITVEVEDGHARHHSTRQAKQKAEERKNTSRRPDILGISVAFKVHIIWWPGTILYCSSRNRACRKVAVS